MFGTKKRRKYEICTALKAIRPGEHVGDFPARPKTVIFPPFSPFFSQITPTMLLQKDKNRQKPSLLASAENPQHAYSRFIPAVTQPRQLSDRMDNTNAAFVFLPFLKRGHANPCPMLKLLL